jgi:hypothetical protein
MVLFIAVTLYAWLAIRLLEHWRTRRSAPGTTITTVTETA